jgi:hypothetical protein
MIILHSQGWVYQVCQVLMGSNGNFNGNLWWFNGIYTGFTRPGKRANITMERSTMLFMGKLTISMAIFNSKPVSVPEGRWAKNLGLFLGILVSKVGV